MYLAKIDVANFRSLREMTVDLHPGLNVLVGRNNTGKTNLLQAIRHAIGPSASRGEPLWLDREDFYRESARDTTERTISITLTFEGLSEPERAYFYEIVQFDLQNLANSRATVRFEASWPSGKRQPTIRRTTGPLTAEMPEIPTKLLGSIPVTFLPALRDAEAHLAPGHRSRLAVLLRDIAERKGGTTKDDIETIFTAANRGLESQPLIKDTVASLQSSTLELAGSDYSPSAIKAADVEFERILRTLQVQMDETPIGSLDANGLGYNNLLYTAVVLEHLKNPDPDDCPIFLIEEPEAHLHPQLTALLADYLSNNTPGDKKPQTILTTHSPTLTARIQPKRIHVLFADPANRGIRCNSLKRAGMDDDEERQLQRMMDITRATLYFAKAAILVEGISEALLIPVLAKRLDYDLAQKHISVIPICGVAFGTFKKLLSGDALGIPVAIVTDSDPPVAGHPTWTEAMPNTIDDEFEKCARTKELLTEFKDHPTVTVRSSKLTLEYDLAEAGDQNAEVMADVWESCFKGTPGTFNRSLLGQAGTERKSRALAAWRGICRASHSGSKADFAQRLAGHLESRIEGKWKCPDFVVPEYLKLAIEDAVKGAELASKQPGDPQDARAKTRTASGAQSTRAAG
jgi:putative ATP-dependent endonuclease of OLD family